MKYDFVATPTDQIFTAYPDLFKLYEETCSLLNYAPYRNPENCPHAPLSGEEICMLVVYVYHQKSPLIDTASMYARRGLALKKMGIVITEDDLNKPSIFPFIAGSNSFLNHLAIRFCKLEPNAFDWLELCRLLDVIDDIYLTLKMEQYGTEKKGANEILKIKLDIDEKSRNFRDRASVLSKKIFAGDSELINLVGEHNIFEKRMALITPERVVRKERERKTT